MRFPFGAPVLSRPAASVPSRSLFVLGACASALHVQWTPAAPAKPIKAIPVDNEPEPFWDGQGEEELIAGWKAAVGYQPQWGTLTAPGDLHGSSGARIKQNVLEPLGVARADTWFTDVLSTYRCSKAAAARIKDTYAPEALRLGLPAADLARHPDEEQIVAEGLRLEGPRIMGELEAVGPIRLVTLGNAALRVIRALLEDEGGTSAPRKLLPGAGYGAVVHVRVAGRDVEWLPLAHPHTPEHFQVAHEEWKRGRRPG